MPSAYRRSFMHEEDGAGKDPVPPDKRSKSVGRTERKTTRAEDAVKRIETKSLRLFERADMWIFMHILAFETHIESL